MIWDPVTHKWRHYNLLNNWIHLYHSSHYIQVATQHETDWDQLRPFQPLQNQVIQNETIWVCRGWIFVLATQNETDWDQPSPL